MLLKEKKLYFTKYMSLIQTIHLEFKNKNLTFLITFK